MHDRVSKRIAGALAVIVCCAPLVAAAQDTGTYLNILPPGQRGYLNTAEGLAYLDDGTLPPHVDDQREMYGNLVFAPPGLTDNDLLTYFKTAPIAPSTNPPDTLNPPINGVTITRDDFGVPHVKGMNRKAMFRGVGYAMAQDRLFAMDLGRHAGRGRLSEMIGPDPFALEQDEAFYQFAGYNEADFQAQITQLLEENPNGKRALRDIEAFIEGVNIFIGSHNGPGSRPIEYLGLDKQLEFFTVSDVLASATLLEQQFGGGGGGEHQNAILLQKLQNALGASDGRKLFDDLRSAEEAEAPVTTELSFPYQVQGTVDPYAVAMPDVGSIVQAPITEVTGTLPSFVTQVVDVSYFRRKGPHPSMSNWLGITGAKAAGGHPIAVMGPQMGYFIPELVTEISMESGRFLTRGAAVTGAPYVVLGRGRNYAWSATSGGSDMTDVRAEKLCVPGGGTPAPNATDYVFNGECIPMYVRTDTWCAGTDAFCASNGDNITATVQRTVHGIVFARATVAGEPIALVKQRASFFREGENSAAFIRINKRADTPRKFMRGMSFAPGSFNWLYVNQDDLFYFHSGRYPIRPVGVDFEMPTWGTGEWEWRGFLTAEEHPTDLNPAQGFMTSWNNKPARDWHAADANYSFGSVHRVDSLTQGVEAALLPNTPLTIANMVEIMEDAGTTDLRGTQVLPLALSLIGSEPGLDPILTIMQDWVNSGAFRRDRDDSGLYDHGTAVAIMDEWFPRMIHAAFDGQLSAFYGDIPMGFDDKPGPRGSAYQSGFYGYLDKTLRAALGQPVTNPYQLLRCADGTQAGCRTVLVQSLNDTVDALETEFSSTDPADWQADPAADQIEFQAFGLAAVDPIPWVNRPTFQQVVQVTSRNPQ
jgi:acyl-homoserine lactone acylase PvdQ